MATLATEVLEKMVLPENEADEDSPRYASQLPEPKGYKLLIALPEVDEATEGGIIKSAQSQHEESIATVVGWVMARDQMRMLITADFLMDRTVRSGIGLFFGRLVVPDLKFMVKSSV